VVSKFEIHHIIIIYFDTHHNNNNIYLLLVVFIFLYDIFITYTYRYIGST